MAVDGNRAELRVTPRVSGIHGVEVNVLANFADSNVIDRAAFLTFDVEPTVMETVNNQIRAATSIGAVSLILVILIVLLWRKRSVR
jgi:hypothetical protein